MKTKRLIWMLGLALLAALLISGTAFAEGEEISDPAPAETSQAPPADPVETGPPPEETTAAEPPEEREPAEPGPAPESEPIEAGADEEEEPFLAPEEGEPAEVVGESEAPAEEPGETEESAEGAGETEEPQEQETGEGAADEVKVVDAGGGELGVEAAAGAGDPRWQVGKQWYSSVTAEPLCYAGTSVADGTCFVSTTPFQTAFDEIDSNPAISPTKGLIYVDYGTYTENITINGSITPNLAGLRGLIGVPDGGLSPTINGSISISNLAGGFTLSGFTIINSSVNFTDNSGALTLRDLVIFQGGVNFNNNNGALTMTDVVVNLSTGNGMVVNNHTGSVSLTRVNSSGNSGYGIKIDNTADGNVTITNSSFDHNTGAQGYGLHINTNGIVSINGLTANNNAQTGLWLYDFSRLTLENAVLNDNLNAVNGYGARLSTDKPAPVTIKYVYALRNKAAYGIVVRTGGKVIVDGVHASENSYNGMRIDTTDGLGTVRIANSRFENNNIFDGYGLEVHSNRAITLVSVAANGNGGIGASLNNSYGSGNVVVTSPASAGFTGANSFSNNTGMGLKILTNGSVTLTNVTMCANNEEGLYVDNLGGSGGVTINRNLAGWVNDFSGSVFGHGLEIDTNGNVLISDIMADGNNWHGLQIASSANRVSITRGEFNRNGRAGLYIEARGAVTLSDVSASGNGLVTPGLGYGAYIDNVTIDGSAGVTIRSSKRDTYRLFSHNELDGINIASNGAVSVSSVCAEGNTLRGLYVNNETILLTLTPGVSVSYATFNHNGYQGLHINSMGSISLVNTSASGNGRHGLHIFTMGSISLVNTSASGNGLAGVYPGAWLENTSGTGNVSIRSSSSSVYYHFSRNTADGIKIDSQGAVSLANVIMEENDYNGVTIDNKGAVSLLNFQAQNNKAGVRINNSHSIINAPVTISASSNRWNLIHGSETGYGLNISSKGNISIARLDSQENALYGASIFNNNAAGRFVNISNSVFRSNSADATYALEVYSAGAVTLTNTSVSDNLKTGLYINTSGAVRLVGVEASGNKGAGLYINTLGPVSITNASAENNGHVADVNHSGVYIFSSGAVTISCTSASSPCRFSGNKGAGLYIPNARGAITLSGALQMHDNDSMGAYLYNAYAPPAGSLPYSVSISAAAANNNYHHGIEVKSYGTVTILSVMAENNGRGVSSSTGLLINNYMAGSGSGSVLISGRNFFSRNHNGGLSILTNGSVSASGITAEYNNVFGLAIYGNTFGGSVLLNNIRAQANLGNGVTVVAYGNQTFLNVTSLMNYGTGIYSETNGKEALFHTCRISGNAYHGIHLKHGGGKYQLINTLSFGNSALGYSFTYLDYKIET